MHKAIQNDTSVKKKKGSLVSLKANVRALPFPLAPSKQKYKNAIKTFSSVVVGWYQKRIFNYGRLNSTYYNTDRSK